MNDLEVNFTKKIPQCIHSEFSGEQSIFQKVLYTKFLGEKIRSQYREKRKKNRIIPNRIDSTVH